MSYKNRVLNDFPNSFYLLDEVQSGSTNTYTELLSQYATYQALKDSGITYGQISGIDIYDYSGSLNNGTASFASTKQIMPLVTGSIRGTEFLTSTVVNYSPKGIATKYYKDNSFSIEAWCALPGYNVSTTIVGDTATNTGIFYQNGNIIFKVGSNQVQATVSNSEVIYIVAIFQSNILSLYINGLIADALQIDSYKFSNEAIAFQSGPSSGRFVVDCVGFYRYALSGTQILSHYSEGTQEVNISQIVAADNGYLFSMNTESLRPKFIYSYPTSKTWSEVATGGISISDDNSYIYIPETTTAASASFTFTDYFIVPNYLNIDTSQIHWSNDVSGILVEASIDNITWRTCKNGSPLPYINKNDNQFSQIVYLRITLSSADTTKYLPILRSLEIAFYTGKNFYSDNSGYYVSSAYDYSLPKFNSKTLSYNKNNGLTMYNGHGFSLNSIPAVSCIEMIYTPQYNENVLFSGAAKKYEWNSAGAVTKTGISSIYVNGIDRTAETNVWNFLVVDTPHHIVINLTSSDTSIKFNQNQNDTKSGLGHMYNNVAVYESTLSVNRILNHYLLYTGNTINQINDTSFSLVESSSGEDLTPFFITVVEPESVSL
jgi:hypothetical protein